MSASQRSFLSYECPDIRLAVMRESLRLAPTAPARTAMPIEDTVLGGKYAVEKGTSILVNTWSAHRDPKVWGEDVRDSPFQVFVR